MKMLHVSGSTAIAEGIIHIGNFTVTITVKRNNRHSAK